MLATQLAFLILRVLDRSWQTEASLVADVLTFIAAGTSLALSLVDHQRALRPSTLLALYLSTLIVLGIARTRTLWLMRLGSSVPAVETANFVFIVTALVLESLELRSLQRTDQKLGAPEQYSSFWNRTCFAWLGATLRLGHANVMSVDDLPSLDTHLQSATLRDKLISSWTQRG